MKDRHIDILIPASHLGCNITFTKGLEEWKKINVNSFMIHTGQQNDKKKEKYVRKYLQFNSIHFFIHFYSLCQ